MTRTTSASLIGLALCALCAGVALAAPAGDLAAAKTELAASHAYKADALLQGVVKSPDAGRAQVEEALYLQAVIYYGDVFASSLVLPSVAGVAKKPEPFGKKVSERLLLASRAFCSALNKYLNITAPGSKLTALKAELPPFSEDDVKKLQDTLSSKPAVQALLDGYSKDPAASEGLYAKASQFGLYLGFAGALPKDKERKFAAVKGALAGGVAFDPARYLDWAASVLLDIDKMVHDPVPEFDKLALSRRCDERLLKLAPAASQFAKNAKARLGSK